MEEYDWYSCDSSSWIQSAAFGSIILPGASKSNPALPISVSSKSPSKHAAEQHISTLNPEHRSFVEKFLETNGFNYERLSEIYESRAACNLWAFGEINNLMNKDRRTNYLAGKRQDIFGGMAM
jgi:hypothetical protein